MICFDLDNTLISSDKAHFLAYNAALEQNGLKKVTFKKIVKLFGRPNEEVVKILTKIDDLSLRKKVYNDHYSFLIKKYYKYVKVFPGVRVTLKKLKKRYKLAIISNTSHKAIVALLSGAKLDRKLFDVLIGNDDVEKSKPSPDEILKAEKLLHHKAKFMVGDSIYDIMAGKRANVKTIAIPSGRYSRSSLNGYGPDFLISKFEEILRIV